MKRIVSISFIFAAVAVMLSASVVPHHHHGAVACMEAHSCEGGECDDDLHSCKGGGCDDNRHPHESESTDHSGGCIVDTPFIDRPERNDKGAGSGCVSPDCGHDGHTHLFILAQLYSDLFPDEPVADIDHDESVIRYHSVDLFTGGGLRAPPALLC